jgi:hypothetical protein
MPHAGNALPTCGCIAVVVIHLWCRASASPVYPAGYTGSLYTLGMAPPAHSGAWRELISWTRIAVPSAQVGLVTFASGSPASMRFVQKLPGSINVCIDTVQTHHNVLSATVVLSKA